MLQIEIKSCGYYTMSTGRFRNISFVMKVLMYTGSR